LKRERHPPGGWRKNMLLAAAFLVLLDAAILSSNPTEDRLALAVGVTAVVGFVIAEIWRSNVRIERAAAAGAKGR